MVSKEYRDVSKFTGGIAKRTQVRARSQVTEGKVFGTVKQNEYSKTITGTTGNNNNNCFHYTNRVLVKKVGQCKSIKMK